MTTQKTYLRFLTVAGSDSGGCAGIQADVKTASACGCYAATAITALTVQNTQGVRAVHIPPAQIVAGQVEAVLEDIGADAVKIGMLPSAEIVHAVAGVLERFGVRSLVLDPVMVATSGDRLIDAEATDAIVRRLMPLALLVTPNIPEAEAISGVKISSPADFDRAAERFAALGTRGLLIKAGHLASETVADRLYPDLQAAPGESLTFEYDYIDTPNTHGTGCSLSSAIAAYLAHGHSLAEAVALAEEYLHKALLCGADYAIGRGHGPLHHFYRFWE